MTSAGDGRDEEMYNVHVVMHDAEEGGYWAEILELPGCMSQGETEEETLRNIEQAFRGILQSYMEDGEEVPLDRSMSVRSLQVPALA